MGSNTASQGICPRPFFLRCPHASGCSGDGPAERYTVRWVAGDCAHRFQAAVSEKEALAAAGEYVREGARCACVSLMLHRVRP